MHDRVWQLGVLVLLVTSRVSASTIIVATNGNDTTGNGSLSQPYKTINKGLQMSVNGDAVRLRGGTYSGAGNRNVNFLGRSVVLGPYGEYAPENVTIDVGGSPNRAFVFDQGETSSSRIENLTIVNGDVRTRMVDGYADKHGGAIKMAASPTIYGVTFQNCRAWTGGAIYISKSGQALITPIVRNCVFVADSSNDGLDGGGITASINAAGTIDSCEFHNCYAAGSFHFHIGRGRARASVNAR
jgi:hypothetical protein